VLPRELPNVLTSILIGSAAPRLRYEISPAPVTIFSRIIEVLVPGVGVLSTQELIYCSHRKGNPRLKRWHTYREKIQKNKEKEQTSMTTLRIATLAS
jgi:hypothetical protein